jgi:hypothetical protein
MRSWPTTARFLGLALTLSAGTAGPSIAQEPTRPSRAAAPAPAAPANFGIEDDQVTVLESSDFSCSGTYCIGGINVLPNGALLTQVALYVEDSSEEEDFEGIFFLRFLPSATGGSPALQLIADLSTSGSPGPTVVYEFLNRPIVYQQDVDRDGQSDVVSYALQFTSNPPDIRFHMVRLRWRRQVSPAPAGASFGDVPTHHAFFQFVEALADSGITVGCGSGNYCPDAPLTRGQMAVFLAKALGLHWPWDAQ